MRTLRPIVAVVAILSVVALPGCAFLQQPSVQDELAKIEQIAFQAGIEFIDAYLKTHLGAPRTVKLTQSKPFVNAANIHKDELTRQIQAKYPNLDKQRVSELVSLSFDKGVAKEVTR